MLLEDNKKREIIVEVRYEEHIDNYFKEFKIGISNNRIEDINSINLLLILKWGMDYHSLNDELEYVNLWC